MKAFVCTKYGAPDVLQLKERSTPQPAENQILIRVHATTVNSGDCRIRRADPAAVRLIFGWKKPRKEILGTVFSGVVEQLGKNATHFQVGDEIYGSTGMNFGAYATYICLNENAIIDFKPKNLSHEEVASLPFGGLTALSFLNKIDIQQGQTVLINGASGAVGNAMLQLAKNRGAIVTVVSSLKNHVLLKSLGADDVIDYQSTELSSINKQFDVVIDTVNKLPIKTGKKLLKSDGKMALSAAGFGEMIAGMFLSLGKRKAIMGVAKETTENLKTLSELAQAGKLKPVIDRVLPFEEIRAAHAFVDKGHKVGSVVIRIAD